MPGVIAFERNEKEEKEKQENQRWAEEQLREMETKSKAAKINKAAAIFDRVANHVPW